MSTSDDSILFSSRLSGSLLKVSARPRLGILAADIVKRRGSPKPSAGQPMAVLVSAARKLAATGGDLASLTCRERKAAIELFWLRMEGWVPKVQDVQAWVSWASVEWSSRSGITRTMMSFIRNFDPESGGTKEFAPWLSTRTDVIAGQFGNFVREHNLVEGVPAVDRIVQGLLDGRLDFFRQLDQDIRTKTVVHGSGLLVQIVEAFGRKCSSAQTVDTENVCRRLLVLFGQNGLAGARGSEAMRDKARVSMVTGVVRWAVRNEESQTAVDLALEVALSLAKDPRLSRVHWRDLEADVVEQVETWLTARTVENMFRVIEELRTDRQDMVRERLAFWRSYLPHIKKAYLLCAKKAEGIADGLNERYGLLRGMMPDHCGLLLQIVGPQGHRVTVIEFNKNASALFWGATSGSAPPFFDKNYEYYGPTMRSSAEHQKRHTPNLWQDQFAMLIDGETGIRQALARGYR